MSPGPTARLRAATPCTCSSPAMSTATSTVDGSDAQLLAGAMGTSAGQPGYLPAADANQDGVINAADAQLLGATSASWPTCPRRSTAGQALTHQDLPVSVDLATLANDAAGDPIYFRVLNPQDGTATLSPDGHTVIFVPPRATPARPASSSRPMMAMGPRHRRRSRSTSAPRRWSTSISRRGPIALDPGGHADRDRSPAISPMRRASRCRPRT